jgi:hypothetical protein
MNKVLNGEELKQLKSSTFSHLNVSGFGSPFYILHVERDI